MRWFTSLGLTLGVCVLIGCAAGSPEESPTQSTSSKRSGFAFGVDEVKGENKPAAKGDAQQDQLAGNPKERADGAKKPAGGETTESVARKKISTGHIELSVEKYESAVSELKALVKNSKGYIANSDDSGAAGAQRTGTYTVRVPANEFDSFMDTVALLGELRRRTGDTQDITDQYYDTAAHIKNDEARQEGLRKLYDRTAEKGRIEDLLAVDRELSNITGRIEEQKGRLNRWDKEVAYSRVVVQLSQRTEFHAAGTPDFGTTVSRTWEGSLNTLSTFGKGLVIVAVAVAPWLAILAVGMSPLWILLWRQVRKHRAAKPTPPSPPTLPLAEPPASARTVQATL
jgi:hypothetical protein